ncbi:Ubiquitin-like modifier-activating enzyme 5 [Morella rubra]|uniref:Ubiquitin-like modifier-activating enzyme 5 n=1 Tax=Morella rubra TaxID=262757 RepID=A0A6A1WLE1_9ROSI|nr:Ubiquitin-like modifier-activating enzyme 5 [Morella rubra]
MSIAHCRRPAVLRFSCTAACLHVSILGRFLHTLTACGNDKFYLQNEYILAMPARDAARRAKMEAEDLLATEGPLHADNEWNISVLGDNELDSIDAASSGLVGIQEDVDV